MTVGLVDFSERPDSYRNGSYAGNAGSKRAIARIYGHADVLHGEPIGRVADEYVELAQIPADTFDNVASCRYDAPDYWEIGEVYGRLVEDVCGAGPIEGIVEVYTSWIDGAMSNYNSDFYYQPKDYLRKCYRTGEVLG